MDGITVRELIKWLENQDENAKVYIGNYLQNYRAVELVDTDKDNYQLEGYIIIKGK